MKNLTIYFLGSILLLLVGCEPDINIKSGSSAFYKGDINPEKFVVIGGNFLSGYTDNELYYSAQLGSLGGILGRQMVRVGGQSFNQPFMFDDYGFGGRVVLRRKPDCKGVTQLVIENSGNAFDSRNNSNIQEKGPFHNFGVPGASLSTIIQQGYGQQNKYFARMETNSNASILQDALQTNPSFFVFWCGENDAYTYARAGGPDLPVNGEITSVNTFRANVISALNQLTSRGAKGLIASIPELKDLPFFTAIPYDTVVLTQAEADQLNLIYTAFPTIRFKAGRNPFVIQDGVLPRFIQRDEYVLLNLNLDSVKCNMYGTVNPLPDAAVLTRSEIAQINTAIRNFNAIISEMATRYNLAYFDAKSYFEEMRTQGFFFDGVKYNSELVKGGFISLDGIYPTPRGNAIVANRMINLMNGKFNANIPLSDITRFSTVAIP